MRALTQTAPMNEPINSSSEIAICQIGTSVTASLTTIRMGENNGIRDSTTASAPSGFSTRKEMNTNATIMGMVMGISHDWASWDCATADPTAANRLA